LELIGELWNQVISRPMINSLVLLYWVFFSNFGLAIIVFTIATRALMVPLTIRQVRLTKAMGALAPKAKEITQKYKDDPQRRSQETMKLYRESGVNPIGCLGPLVVQMPIFIGLFWALRATLASTPEGLADLSSKLYPWLPGVGVSIPIDPHFLGLNLGDITQSSPVGPVLALVVAASTWLMQKMSTVRATSDQQAQTNRMLLWMMPIMIGFFSLNFETGLTLYWTASNIVGIIVQGFIGGWAPFREALTFGSLGSILGKAPVEADESDSEKSNKQLDGTVVDGKARALNSAEISDSAPLSEEAISDDHSGTNGKDSRRSNRTRANGARRRTRGSRNRRR
jgi:YidC/Oxa1 family membrane protein insertase